MVDRPITVSSAQRARGIDYATAVEYVDATYQVFQSRLENLDRFDLGTKAGLGVGVGGAAISTAVRSGIDPILGFLTLGAVSYATNQLVDPKSLEDVFSAGLANLDCIDAAGARANEAVIALRPALVSARPDIESAMLAYKAISRRPTAIRITRPRSPRPTPLSRLPPRH